MISFHNLPVEAYPDVANTWVQVITQWPGRAAEEVEQQVTIPIEIQMNGIPHLQHVRSASLAGLSVVNLIFDDDSDNDWDRQKALERLSQVTLPPGVSGGIGPDFSPIGSVYWYTLKSTNPVLRPDGTEVSAGLGGHQVHSIGAGCGRRFIVRRYHSRIPDTPGPRQTGLLWSEPGTG